MSERIEIYTQSDPEVGKEISSIDSWPNLYPVHDAADQDVPRTIEFAEPVTVVAVSHGNECRLNIVTVA